MDVTVNICIRVKFISVFFLKIRIYLQVQNVISCSAALVNYALLKVPNAMDFPTVV